MCEERHLLTHRIQFSTAPPLWSAVKSVLSSSHTPTVMMEEGLHRCVQVVHTNTTLICAYNAPASKQRRDRVCVWYLYIQMTWNKWKNYEYGGHVGYNYTKVPLIIIYETAQLKSINVFFFCHQMVFTNYLALFIVYWWGSVPFNVCINMLQYRTLSVNRLGS